MCHGLLLVRILSRVLRATCPQAPGYGDAQPDDPRNPRAPGRAKPDMNSFTYMRSEADCVWQILCEQATLRDRRFIGSQAAHRVILIFQDLEASTPSASIRTGVNEMMSRFGQGGTLVLRHHCHRSRTGASRRSAAALPSQRHSRPGASLMPAPALACPGLLRASAVAESTGTLG